MPREWADKDLDGIMASIGLGKESGAEEALNVADANKNEEEKEEVVKPAPPPVVVKK